MIEQKPIRVIVADDHPIVRRGIVDLLSETDAITVVAEAVDGIDALGACTDLDLDVLVMDLRMPGLNGIEVTSELASKRPSIRVLILTTFEDDADVLAAIRAGANGYLLKATSPASIISAIKAVAVGQTVLGPSIAARVLKHPAADGGSAGAGMRTNPLMPAASYREVQILELLQEGKTNTEIAVKLTLSEHTIHAHLRRIFHKLGAKNRAHAVKLAQLNGWLDGDRRER